MPRNVFFMSMAILSASAFAESCPKCRDEVQSTDSYCPGCGHDLVAWRQSLIAPKQAPVASNPVARQISQTDGGSVTPFELSLIGPVGIPGGFFDSVTGLQISMIYGDSEIMKGVQMGLIQCDTEMYGLQLGFWNQVTRVGEVLQVGCVNFFAGSHNDVRGKGAQIGVINYAERMSGFLIGYINDVEQEFHGIQIGAGNNPPESMHCDVHGLQIGILNTARNMTGVQIGLVNIIVESPVPFFPFVNMHF